MAEREHTKKTPLRAKLCTVRSYSSIGNLEPASSIMIPWYFADSERSPFFGRMASRPISHVPLLVGIDRPERQNESTIC